MLLPHRSTREEGLERVVGRVEPADPRDSGVHGGLVDDEAAAEELVLVAIRYCRVDDTVSLYPTPHFV